MTTKGPQQIRKERIKQMQDSMFDCVEWTSYQSLEDTYIYNYGSSKYKTKEYFDIISRVCSDSFQFKYDNNGKITELKVRVSDETISNMQREKQELEQKLRSLNVKIESVNQNTS